MGEAARSQAMTPAHGLASTRTLPLGSTLSQRRVLPGCYTPHDPSCCLLLTSWSLVFAAAREAGSTETRRPCAPCQCAQGVWVGQMTHLEETEHSPQAVQ